MIKSSVLYDYKNQCYDGCSCHNSKNLRRALKHSTKRRETRLWKKDASA